MAKSNEQVSENDLTAYLSSSECIRPRLIVFDLDYTLWPYFANRYYQAPFHTLKATLVDAKNKKVTYFKDVPRILKVLKENFAQELAIASRCGDRKTIEALLDALGWSGYFSSMQIYGGNKSRHIRTICSDLNIVDLSEVLFFDDDAENVYNTMSLGVVTHLVDKNTGLDFHALLNGLRKYNSKRK